MRAHDAQSAGAVHRIEVPFVRVERHMRVSRGPRGTKRVSVCRIEAPFSRPGRQPNAVGGQWGTKCARGVLDCSPQEKRADRASGMRGATPSIPIACKFILDCLSFSSSSLCCSTRLGPPCPPWNQKSISIFRLYRRGLAAGSADPEG